MARRRTVGRASGGGATVVGAFHGKSVHNPATYEALRRHGMSKARAAAISNGVLARGVRKGRRHGK